MVWEAAVRAGKGRAYVCVVSDHGFTRIEKEIRLNAALREAGLIELDGKGALKSWRAIAWNSGGSTAIMMKDKQDAESRQKVRAVLTRFASDPSVGMFRFLEGDEAKKSGGFPDAEFIVGAKPGTYFGGGFDSPVTRVRGTGGGHGFFPELNDMDSSFFLVGPGIPGGRNLGRIDMRDIAPTLARLLRVRLPEAEGRNLLTH